MRIRHSTGGVRKQRGRWIGMWYADGKRKSKVVGSVKEMTKSEAREEVAKSSRKTAPDVKPNAPGSLVSSSRGLFSLLQPEVEGLDEGKQREQGFSASRIGSSVIGSFRVSGAMSFRTCWMRRRRDGLSFSVVDHLRWDMKQIFDMAVAEGQIERNPALLLFTPREARSRFAAP